MTTEIEEVWSKNGKEYKIVINNNTVTIQGVIKYDIRHGIPMPVDFIPNSFVKYEVRDEVVVPVEKLLHFETFLEMLGYKKIEE